MAKGKPSKKHPRPQTKGKGKHEDKRQHADGDQVDNKIEKVVNDNGTVDDVEPKKYAKRKIESNWGRYKEPEVDEHEVVDDYDETKDFEYIRQNSASASSHFKFREEREWEHDLHQPDNEERSVLGLNLIQLANDMKQYGVEDKLGLKQLMPEECRYCIKENCDSVISRPQQLPCETTKPSERPRWSYEGVGKYKSLIGLAPVNEEIQIYEKSVDSSNNSTNTEYKDFDRSGHKNTRENSYDSNVSDDVDTLDELLMNKISFDDPSDWLDKFKDNVNEAIIDNDKLNLKSNNTAKMKKESERSLKVKNHIHSSKTGSGVNKTIENEELDLDMLLETDVHTSGSKHSNSKEEQVDNDLDQWLDDMLI